MGLAAGGVLAQTQPPAGQDMPVHRVEAGKLKISVVEPGVLEASVVSSVVCQVDGQATIIKILPEGTIARKGDIVCELDSAGLRERLAAQETATGRAEAAYQNAKLAREAAEIAVAEYVEGIFKQESFSLKGQILGAEAAIEKAEDRLERTRKARERVREAAKAGTKSPADIVAELDIEDRLIDAEGALEREKTALVAAKSKLNVLERYTLPKTTKSLKVDVERKHSEELIRRTNWELEGPKLASLRRQVESCVMRAPADGVVVYANEPGRRGGRGRSSIEQGATVRGRQVILKQLDLSEPLQVVIKVPETQVDKVNRGMKARITVDALGDKPMPGLVMEVAPLPDPFPMFDGIRKVYTTRVRLPKVSPQLRPGMTARVEILIDERENVLTVPVQAIASFDHRDKVAVKRPDGTFVLRDVLLGAASSTDVEVMKGLEAGDFVALNASALLTPEQKRETSSTGPPIQPPAAKPDGR
jgi:multidrug resistance efflux pump